jgi:hypothetical protein
LQQFQQLTYKKKVEIDKNILSVLNKKWNNDAWKILDRINEMDIIPNNLLNNIYLDFERSIDKIKEWKVENQLYSFSKTKEYTDFLRQQEKAEMAKENLDDLLKNI